VDKIVPVPKEKVVYIQKFKEVPVTKKVEREVIKENIKEKIVPRDKLVEKEKVVNVDKKVLVDKIVEVAVGENVVEKSVITEVPMDKMTIKIPRYEEEVTWKTVPKDRIVERPTERVVHDERLVEVPVDKPVDRMVEVIREVQKEVVVHQDKVVEVPRELRVDRISERIVTKEVKVPVTILHETIKEVQGAERVVNVPYEKCVAVEKKVPFDVIHEYAEAQVLEAKVNVDKTVTEIVPIEVKVPVELLVDKITVVDKFVDKVVQLEVEHAKEVVETVPFIEEYLKIEPGEQTLQPVETKVPLRRDVPNRVRRDVELFTTSEKLHPITTSESSNVDKKVEVRVWQERVTTKEVPLEVEVLRHVDGPRVVAVDTEESLAAKEQLKAMEELLDKAILDNRKRELDHIRARRRLEKEIEHEQQLALELAGTLSKQLTPIEVVRQVIREKEVVKKVVVKVPRAKPATPAGPAPGESVEEELRKQQGLLDAEKEYQAALELEKKEAEAERQRLERSLANAQKRVEQLEREARAKREALLASRRLESKEVFKTVNVATTIRVPHQ
jgi:hypothetical protein